MGYRLYFLSTLGMHYRYECSFHVAVQFCEKCNWQNPSVCRSSLLLQGKINPSDTFHGSTITPKLLLAQTIDLYTCFSGVGLQALTIYTAASKSAGSLQDPTAGTYNLRPRIGSFEMLHLMLLIHTMVLLIHTMVLLIHTMVLLIHTMVLMMNTLTAMPLVYKKEWSRLL